MESEVSLILRDCAYRVIGDCVGVETGAYALVRDKHTIVCALGDFDSVTKEEFELIQLNVKNIIKVSSIKDETDSELAIKWCIKQGYKKIHLFGALNGRLDHQRINVLLAYKYPNVILYDDSNKIQAYAEGEYQINREDYSYFSVFTYAESIISLAGFTYPLEHYKLRYDDLKTVSNQWIKKDAQLTVHQGKVLVYLSR
jgi:thiamine pyrophosphokinase